MAMRMSDRSFGHSSSKEVLNAYIGKLFSIPLSAVRTG